MAFLTQDEKQDKPITRINVEHMRVIFRLITRVGDWNSNRHPINNPSVYERGGELYVSWGYDPLCKFTMIIVDEDKARWEAIHPLGNKNGVLIGMWEESIMKFVLTEAYRAATFHNPLAQRGGMVIENTTRILPVFPHNRHNSYI